LRLIYWDFARARPSNSSELLVHRSEEIYELRQKTGRSS
jgi:hypothetical protein